MGKEINEEKLKALLIGVNIDNPDFEKSMDELKSLAEANYYEVVGNVTQNLKVPNRAIYVGTGKVDEIKTAINMYDADVIIFNNELSPTQIRNLEKYLDITILDRTSLIIQIFSDRARTREAKLQVEVAKLEYMLPRLAHLHTDLGRQGGSAGVSNKGSGEKKIELDRRRIEAELDTLKEELEQLSVTRNTQRKRRKKSGVPRVSLVGYTNAGKSTLLNALLSTYGDDNNEDKKVFEKDMLFATLETNVRNIKLNNNKEFLLSDTVGFVRELPHNLIKAFRSTLEEIKDADLLLHVIDISDSDYINQQKVTLETLKTLGADDIPMIYVYNKCDLNEEIKFPKVCEDKIYLSAHTGEGIDELIKKIEELIYKSYVRCKVLIPYSDGDIVNYFINSSTVYKIDYTEDGTEMDIELKESDYNRYKEYVKKSVSRVSG